MLFLLVVVGGGSDGFAAVIITFSCIYFAQRWEKKELTKTPP